MLKDFFYFTKRERIGLLLLAVLVLGIFIGKFLFTPKNQPVSENQEKQRDTISAISSTDLPEKQSAQTNLKQPQRQQNRTPATETKTYYSQPQQYVEPTKSPSKPQYQQVEKLAEGATLELNSADTTELKKLPGIGSSFARKIEGYRRLLGGYYRKEQLQEVYGMYVELYEKIEPYLVIDSSLIVPVDVNTTSLDRLKAHPYLNFYQAKAIVELRRKKGKLTNINELSLLEEFSENDLEKIIRYLKF